MCQGVRAGKIEEMTETMRDEAIRSSRSRVEMLTRSYCRPLMLCQEEGALSSLWAGRLGRSVKYDTGVMLTG